MQSAIKYIYNFNWLLSLRILKTIGVFLIFLALSIYLSTEEFGQLQYSISVVSIFILFVHLGLEQVVVKKIVESPDKQNLILTAAFCLKIIGSTIALLLIQLTMYFLETNATVVTLVTILSFGFIAQSFDVIDYYFQAKLQSKYVAMARFFSLILSMILVWYFILYKYSVIYFAIISVVELCTSAALLLIFFRRHNKLIWRLSFFTIKGLMKLAWPLALSALMVTIYMKIDQVMIGNMLNMEQVGIYSIAVKVSELWFIVPAVLVAAITPYIVNLRSEDKNTYKVRLRQIYSLMFWGGVVVGIFFSAFGHWIIELLFGAHYIAAYEPLIFNIWSGIFVSQGMALSIWILCEGLQKYAFFNVITTALINISLNLMLIPYLGIKGAAIATIISHFLSAYVTIFFWKSLRAGGVELIRSINPLCLKSLFLELKGRA